MIFKVLWMSDSCPEAYAPCWRFRNMWALFQNLSFEVGDKSLGKLRWHETLGNLNGTLKKEWISTSNCGTGGGFSDCWPWLTFHLWAYSTHKPQITLIPAHYLDLHSIFWEILALDPKFLPCETQVAAMLNNAASTFSLPSPPLNYVPRRCQFAWVLCFRIRK